MRKIVALRKESVDRNAKKDRQIIKFRVALRKESVDRNGMLCPKLLVIHRRSPQGERG